MCIDSFKMNLEVILIYNKFSFISLKHMRVLLIRKKFYEYIKLHLKNLR